nr:sodium:proton antiporter [Humibacillus xanthopallidus]
MAVLLIVYGVTSRPLDRRGITSAMTFVTLGLVTGASGFGWLDVPLDSAVVERLTELALVFLLFSDSVRMDLKALRHSAAWPSRLLVIAIPGTMVLGFVMGLVVFPGMAVASAFLLATMLCSTDAALGQRVVDDPRVPPRVRQALDVESGFDDGIAVPFFLVALDLTMATLVGGVTSAVLTNIAAQIGWGLLAGLSTGAVGGLALRQADRRGWIKPEWRQAVTFAIAISAYAVAVTLGGSGFIAAFVGGMVFGAVSGQHGLRTTYLTEEVGNVLAAVTWMGFGALAISAVWHDITWKVVLYAVLSLTVVRMVPVAIAMLRTGAARQTVAFMGWFGPRGLASVVFLLLAMERGIPGSGDIAATVVATVGLSVFLHGLTAGPLVGAYHRWFTRQATRAAAAGCKTPLAEGKATVVPRTRRHPDPNEDSAVPAARGSRATTAADGIPLGESPHG